MISLRKLEGNRHGCTTRAKRRKWGSYGSVSAARLEHVGAETIGNEALDLVSICAEGPKLDLLMLTRQQSAETEGRGSFVATHLLGVANDHMRVAVDPLFGHLGILGGVSEDGEDVCEQKRGSAPDFKQAEQLDLHLSCSAGRKVTLDVI